MTVMHKTFGFRCIDEKAVASITGLSLSTLQKHRFHGKGIPYAKIGRAVRYSSTDMYSIMTSMKVNYLSKKINKYGVNDENRKNIKRSKVGHDYFGRNARGH